MNTYLFFKSIHLIAVISWMAGLLYLPRIFVYHAENSNEKKTSEIFKLMEKRLMNYIMNPAMILSWFFGILLVLVNDYQLSINFWLIIKFVLVIFLTIYHFYLKVCLNKFTLDQNKNTPRFYRIINEIPTVILVLIVFIVIYKPL